MQLKPGTLLQGGKYRIIRTLGQGGFGITYEAEQTSLHRKIALKEFYLMNCCDRVGESRVTAGTGSQRDLFIKFRNKFIKEAQTIAGFNQKNIIRVLDVFVENETAYYVMEYMPSGSLADLLSSTGHLSEVLATDYVSQIASALDYIHKHHTVHLDVKPANILLNANGEAVLIDFGTSKHYDSNGKQTSTTPVGYSKGYAPIEQYRDGDISQFKPSTDIYALGATLYSLVTGLVPPDAFTVNEDGLPRAAGVSDALWAVIKKAMMPQRRDRPQTIKEFLFLLKEDFPKNERRDDYKYLTNDKQVTIHRGHGKYWLAIGGESLSELYDEVVSGSLVDNRIVCTKRNGYYAYTYIDIENKCVKSTPFKYRYANALKGKTNYYRDASLSSIIDGYNSYSAIVENDNNNSECLILLKKDLNSYTIYEQEYRYYPKRTDETEFWILFFGSIVGFSIAGCIAASIFHFRFIIGIIVGLVWGIIIFLVNKKECVVKAHVEAIGPQRTMLETHRTGTGEPSGKMREYPQSVGNPPPNIKCQDLTLVNAAVYRMDSAPSCDEVSELECPLTDAKGYYRIKRNGKIGMQHLTDDGEIQELFPYDGKDDLDFEDAWLRLHPQHIQ